MKAMDSWRPFCLLLDTMVFCLLRPWRFSHGDHGVVFLETIVFYSWRPFFIPEDHGVLFLGTSVFLNAVVFYSWVPWCFIPDHRGVLVLSTIVFYSCEDHCVLSLKTTVFSSVRPMCLIHGTSVLHCWKPWCFYSWRPWRCNRGGHFC